MDGSILFDPHDILIDKFIEVLLHSGPDSLDVAHFIVEVSDDSYLQEVCECILDLKELIDDGLL